MQFKQIFLLVIICASSIFSKAQNFGSVSGKLKTKSGEAAVDLNVKIQNSSLSVISNNRGDFSIKSIIPGNYTLIVTGIGYKTEQKTISVTAGKNTEVNLIISDVLIEMEGVTVIGRTLVQKSNRQAFNVTAVDAKQLYNSTLDLAGALDRVAGIRVRESGGVGSNFNLSLNGFSGNHVRYFIDGVPMDGMGSSFQINNIPINAAERIEVYKGVVPIWLGSDALGGAINIVTGDRNRNYIDASYSYGSFNTHRSVLNGAITSEKGLTIQISAFQNYSSNNYKVKVDAADIKTGAYSPGVLLPRFHDVYHNETLIGSVGFLNTSFADKLLIGMTVGSSYKEIQTGARMVSVFGGWHRRGNILMPTLKYKKDNLIKGLDVTLNANYNLGAEINIDTMNVRYDWFGNYKLNGSNGERSRSFAKYRNNNGLATAMVNYKISDRQSIAINNVFSTYNRKSADQVTNVIEQPRKTQKNVLGLGYTYNIEDKWTVSLFGKYFTQFNLISNSNAGSNISNTGYGIAGTYFFTPNLQLKTSYELSNKMPEPTELFGDVENQEGNPKLKPERSDNLNLGLSYNFNISNDDKFILNGNAIYRYSKNFIYNRLNNNQSKLVADNRDGVKTIGGDGEIRYSHRNWFSAGATFTYQYLQNMQKYEPGYNGVSPVYLDQMPNIPFMYGNADVSVIIRDLGRKRNSLNLGYNLLYVNKFYLYWPSRGGDKLNVPKQLSHDLNAVYSLFNGRYNIGLEARNISNTLLYDNFSLQKPGRGFYVNFRYFINKF